MPRSFQSSCIYSLPRWSKNDLAGGVVVAEDPGLGTTDELFRILAI